MQLGDVAKNVVSGMPSWPTVDDAAEAVLDALYLLQEVANVYAIQLIWALVLTAGCMLLWLWRVMGRQEAARRHAHMVSCRPVFSASFVPLAQPGAKSQSSHFVSVYKNRFAAKERIQSEDRCASSDCNIMHGYTETAQYRHRFVPRAVWRRHGMTADRELPHPGDRVPEPVSPCSGRRPVPASSPHRYRRHSHTPAPMHSNRPDSPSTASGTSTPQQHPHNHNHHHRQRDAPHPAYPSAQDWSGIEPAGGDVMLIRGKLSSYGADTVAGERTGASSLPDKAKDQLGYSPPGQAADRRVAAHDKPNSSLRYLSQEDRMLLERIFSVHPGRRQSGEPTPPNKGSNTAARNSTPEVARKLPPHVPTKKGMNEQQATASRLSVKNTELEKQLVERLQKAFLPPDHRHSRPSSLYLTPRLRRAHSGITSSGTHSLADLPQYMPSSLSTSTDNIDKLVFPDSRRMGTPAVDRDARSPNVVVSKTNSWTTTSGSQSQDTKASGDKSDNLGCPCIRDYKRSRFYDSMDSVSLYDSVESLLHQDTKVNTTQHANDKWQLEYVECVSQEEYQDSQKRQTNKECQSPQHSPNTPKPGADQETLAPENSQATQAHDSVETQNQNGNIQRRDHHDNKETRSFAENIKTGGQYDMLNQTHRDTVKTLSHHDEKETLILLENTETLSPKKETLHENTRTLSSYYKETRISHENTETLSHHYKDTRVLQENIDSQSHYCKETRASHEPTETHAHHYKETLAPQESTGNQSHCYKDTSHENAGTRSQYFKETRALYENMAATGHRDKTETRSLRVSTESRDLSASTENPAQCKRSHEPPESKTIHGVRGAARPDWHGSLQSFDSYASLESPASSNQTGQSQDKTRDSRQGHRDQVSQRHYENKMSHSGRGADNQSSLETDVRQRDGIREEIKRSQGHQGRVSSTQKSHDHRTRIPGLRDSDSEEQFSEYRGGRNQDRNEQKSQGPQTTCSQAQQSTWNQNVWRQGSQNAWSQDPPNTWIQNPRNMSESQQVQDNKGQHTQNITKRTDTNSRFGHSPETTKARYAPNLAVPYDSAVLRAIKDEEESQHRQSKPIRADQEAKPPWESDVRTPLRREGSGDQIPRVVKDEENSKDKKSKTVQVDRKVDGSGVQVPRVTKDEEGYTHRPSKPTRTDPEVEQRVHSLKHSLYQRGSSAQRKDAAECVDSSENECEGSQAFVAGQRLASLRKRLVDSTEQPQPDTYPKRKLLKRATPDMHDGLENSESSGAATVDCATQVSIAEKQTLHTEQQQEKGRSQVSECCRQHDKMQAEADGRAEEKPWQTLSSTRSSSSVLCGQNQESTMLHDETAVSRHLTRASQTSPEPADDSDVIATKNWTEQPTDIDVSKQSVYSKALRIHLQKYPSDNQTPDIRSSDNLLPEEPAPPKKRPVPTTQPQQNSQLNYRDLGTFYQKEPVIGEVQGTRKQLQSSENQVLDTSHKKQSLNCKPPDACQQNQSLSDEVPDVEVQRSPQKIQSKKSIHIDSPIPYSPPSKHILTSEALTGQLQFSPRRIQSFNSETSVTDNSVRPQKRRSYHCKLVDSSPPYKPQQSFGRETLEAQALPGLRQKESSISLTQDIRDQELPCKKQFFSNEAEVKSYSPNSSKSKARDAFQQKDSLDSASDQQKQSSTSELQAVSCQEDPTNPKVQDTPHKKDFINENIQDTFNQKESMNSRVQVIPRQRKSLNNESLDTLYQKGYRNNKNQDTSYQNVSLKSEDQGTLHQKMEVPDKPRRKKSHCTQVQDMSYQQQSTNREVPVKPPKTRAPNNPVQETLCQKQSSDRNLPDRPPRKQFQSNEVQNISHQKEPLDMAAPDIPPRKQSLVTEMQDISRKKTSLDAEVSDKPPRKQSQISEVQDKSHRKQVVDMEIPDKTCRTQSLLNEIQDTPHPNTSLDLEVSDKPRTKQSHMNEVQCSSYQKQPMDIEVPEKSPRKQSLITDTEESSHHKASLHKVSLDTEVPEKARRKQSQISEVQDTFPQNSFLPVEAPDIFRRKHSQHSDVQDASRQKSFLDVGIPDKPRRKQSKISEIQDSFHQKQSENTEVLEASFSKQSLANEVLDGDAPAAQDIPRQKSSKRSKVRDAPAVEILREKQSLSADVSDLPDQDIAKPKRNRRHDTRDAPAQDISQEKISLKSEVQDIPEHDIARQKHSKMSDVGDMPVEDKSRQKHSLRSDCRDVQAPDTALQKLSQSSEIREACQQTSSLLSMGESDRQHTRKHRRRHFSTLDDTQAKKLRQKRRLSLPGEMSESIAERKIKHKLDITKDDSETTDCYQQAASMPSHRSLTPVADPPTRKPANRQTKHSQPDSPSKSQSPEGRDTKVLDSPPLPAKDRTEAILERRAKRRELLKQQRERENQELYKSMPSRLSRTDQAEEDTTRHPAPLLTSEAIVSAKPASEDITPPDSGQPKSRRSRAGDGKTSHHLSHTLSEKQHSLARYPGLLEESVTWTQVSESQSENVRVKDQTVKSTRHRITVSPQLSSNVLSSLETSPKYVSRRSLRHLKYDAPEIPFSKEKHASSEDAIHPEVNFKKVEDEEVSEAWDGVETESTARKRARLRRLVHEAKPPPPPVPPKKMRAAPQTSPYRPSQETAVQKPSRAQSEPPLGGVTGISYETSSRPSIEVIVTGKPPKPPVSPRLLRRPFTCTAKDKPGLTSAVDKKGQANGDVRWPPTNTEVCVENALTPSAAACLFDPKAKEGKERDERERLGKTREPQASPQFRANIRMFERAMESNSSAAHVRADGSGRAARSPSCSPIKASILMFEEAARCSSIPPAPLSPKFRRTRNPAAIRSRFDACTHKFDSF